MPMIMEGSILTENNTKLKIKKKKKLKGTKIKCTQRHQPLKFKILGLYIMNQVTIIIFRVIFY